MVDVGAVLSNTSPWIIGLVLLVISELIYFIFVRTEKRRRKQSVFEYTASYKILSWLVTGVFSGVLLLVLAFLKPIMIAIGLVGIVVLYFAINYLIAKKFGKEETEKEFVERIGQNSKFSIGDKVRIKKGLKFVTEDDYGDEVPNKVNSNKEGYSIELSSAMKRYKGRNLTITGFDNEGDLKIKEDRGKNIWSDVMFDKVGKGKK